jgi:hypothetical protein
MYCGLLVQGGEKMVKNCGREKREEKSLKLKRKKTTTKREKKSPVH